MACVSKQGLEIEASSSHIATLAFVAVDRADMHLFAFDVSPAAGKRHTAFREIVAGPSTVLYRLEYLESLDQLQLMAGENLRAKPGEKDRAVPLANRSARAEPF